MTAIVERYRACIVLFFVLPPSFLLRIIDAVKNWYTAPDPAGHQSRVLRVCAAVKRWAIDKSKPMCTDRSSANSHSVRWTDKSQWHRIAMGDLRAILEVHTGPEPFVRVEPGVTVGEITKHLLGRGFQLECTLEMEDATLGGLAAATGMTTHSHVCGLISDTVIAYELVLPDGRLVTATKDGEFAEMHTAFPFSHGALALLVSLTLRIIPAKPFVRLVYTPFASQDEFAQTYRASMAASPPPYFLEAMIFSRDRAVLMEGFLADAEEAHRPGNVRNFIGRWYKPWFYSHAQGVLDKGRTVEFIPIYDYLMRHDKSMCNTMETIMPFGNSVWFRYILGWLLPPKMTLLKSIMNAEAREQSVRKQVFQDVAFPADRLGEAIGVCEDLFDIYPLMCYPCKVYDVAGRMVRSGNNKDRFFLNLGVYGVPRAVRQKKQFKIVHAIRLLEEWVRSVHGFQHSYCDSFQNREEFQSMFDTNLHYELRDKYGATGAFVDVFDKTRPGVDFMAWMREEERM
jgi:delta24-sterol reductase